jgi:hypothetical protein
MFRVLFTLFALIAPITLLVCFGNLWGATRLWYQKRPTNGLGAYTARKRLRWQAVLFGMALALNLLVGAVFLYADPGNHPNSATGWVLYGVLWFFLASVVFLSVDQRAFDHKVKTYPLGDWNGVERRDNRS